MSCGNSEQDLERAGVNALAICRAPYINADGIISECGCPFSKHLFAFEEFLWMDFYGCHFI
jgi:hypothetical protein